ncbi:hypothetical protein BZG02_10110 [Labilibaculum filiforme]|uniref:O-antigen ligase-related domain-containing protein n=1 Tax=Labilibaculum filiforme TaxID=1940526 RepID=A0A2N3HYG3_9BACT|nr:O-antigen ligase family protein [Labilibaculum filiforme]PKQ63110.1 hypothetical protein BZG02_10110 [Labilibaculum filiforme]
MKYVETGFWLLVFFVALLLKSYTIGGQEMAYIWKLPLLIFLFVGVLGQKIDFNFLIFGYVFAVKNLISTSFFEYPIDALINFLKYLTIPLAVHWIYLNINSVESLKKLRMLPVYLASFLIISNIPYYLGVFAAPVSQTMLWMEDATLEGLVGILGAPHYTSALLSVACIILLEFIVKKRGDMQLNLVLAPIFLLGLFFLFKTYTRTGWLMFVVGIGILFVRKISVKEAGKILALSVVLFVGLAALYQTNEGFRRRVTDDRAGQEEKSTYETVGSGRLQIAEVYLENFYQSSFATYLLGMGMQESQNRYEKKDGMPLFAHNGFIQTLVDNGILGFLLYLVFLYSIFKGISRSNSSYNQLSVAIFFMFLSCLVTQQANYFLLDVFVSIFIGISLIENRINNYIEIKNRQEATDLRTHSPSI